MYYELVLALGMAVGAHAGVPDYLGAYSNANKSSTAMLKHLAFETPNSEQLSYVVLKNTISGLADMELLLNLKYEQIYGLGTIVTQAVARASPQFVRDLAKKRNELAEEKTAKLRKIVEEKCFVARSSDVNLAKCNEDIDQALQKAPQNDEAKLFLALGDLGYLHLSLEPELAEVAKNNKESEYLATGKEKLRALVAQTLKTYKLLYK